MSVIKRLANVARGAALTYTKGADADAEAALDAELDAASRPAPPAPKAEPVAAVSPWERQREAVAAAYAAGVLDADERDQKLAAIDAAERAPAKPKRREL